MRRDRRAIGMSRLPGLVKHPSNHWCGDSDVDSDFVAGPSRKKARLSGKRFAVVDAKDVDESKAPLSAKNTDKSTLWAVRAFMSWLQEYNERDGNDEKCPLDVMCLGDDALLCRWLCLFVTEARQSNGKSYTPRSISQLLAGLQRYINSRRDPHEARLRLTSLVYHVFLRRQLLVFIIFLNQYLSHLPFRTFMVALSISAFKSNL